MVVKMPPASPARKMAKVNATPAKPVEDSQKLFDQRVEGLNSIMSLGQGACILSRQYADAAAIGIHGPKLMQEVANLAHTSELVAKSVDWLVTIGPYGGIVLAAYPLVMQILANHKVIDTDKVAIGGIVPSRVLEIQMKASIAEQQAAALAEQQETIKAAEESLAQSQQFLSGDQMTVTHNEDEKA